MSNIWINRLPRIIAQFQWGYEKRNNRPRLLFEETWYQYWCSGTRDWSLSQMKTTLFLDCSASGHFSNHVTQISLLYFCLKCLEDLGTDRLDTDVKYMKTVRYCSYSALPQPHILPSSFGMSPPFLALPTSSSSTASYGILSQSL